MTLADKIPEKTIGVANVFLTVIGVISLGAWAYSIYYYIWTGARQFGSASDIVLISTERSNLMGILCHFFRSGAPATTTLTAIGCLQKQATRKISRGGQRLAVLCCAVPVMH